MAFVCGLKRNKYQPSNVPNSNNHKLSLNFEDVLNLAKTNNKLKEKICNCSPTVAAQIVYARDVEMAQNANDIIERRLGLCYLDCPTGNCKRAIEKIYCRGDY